MRIQTKLNGELKMKTVLKLAALIFLLSGVNSFAAETTTQLSVRGMT